MGATHVIALPLCDNLVREGPISSSSSNFSIKVRTYSDSIYFTHISFVCFIPVVDSMEETLEKMIDGVRIGDEL